MVYFIEYPDSEAIKIGHAADVHGRASDLQAVTDEALRILGVMPGSRPEELSLHHRFSHLRAVSKRNERFKDCPELRDFIRQHAAPWDGPAELDRPFTSAPKKPVVAQVRGSEAYKAWLDELCRVDHRSIADLIELAVAKHAASIGFREPPER